MPTYIFLLRWTHQGVQKLKDSPSRLDAGKEAFQADGVKMLHVFLTTGTHDMLIISEAPNDEAIAKATLSLVAGGNVTTQTNRAFTEDEYRALIKSLP